MIIQRQDGSNFSKCFRDLLADGDIEYKEIDDFKVGDLVFLNRTIRDILSSEMPYGYYKITSIEPFERTIKLSQGELKPWGIILEDTLVFVEYVEKKELRFKVGDIVKEISSGELYRIKQVDDNINSSLPYELESYYGDYINWVSEKQITYPYELYDVVEVIDNTTSGHEVGTVGFITGIFGEMNVEEYYTIMSSYGVNHYHRPNEIQLYKNKK